MNMIAKFLSLQQYSLKSKKCEDVFTSNTLLDQGYCGIYESLYSVHFTVLGAFEINLW